MSDNDKKGQPMSDKPFPPVAWRRLARVWIGGEVAVAHFQPLFAMQLATGEN